MAAIWDLPVLFVCENNLYAASTPFTAAFKIKNVSERAPAYGIPAEQVDVGPAARFLQRVAQLIERPHLLIA